MNQSLFIKKLIKNKLFINRTNFTLKKQTKYTQTVNSGYQVISSDAFSNISDMVYSRYVEKNFIQKKQFENYEILSERGNFYLVKIKNFTLSDSSIIYSNTEALDFLFEDLKQVEHFKNLILITHESDLPITEKVFSSKPSCISKWFGINVFYENENLIPIPIGVPGKFTEFYDKDYKYEETLLSHKLDKIYINFRDNTNSKERSGLKSYFEKKDWAVVDNDKIDPDEYQKNLKKYTYNLCPIGNGVDTYRIWETLVAGSIPVTKKHPALNSFEKFPIIFLENLKFDNLESLKLYSKNFNVSNLNFLDIKYWKKIIIEAKEPRKDTLEVKIYQNDVLFNKKRKHFAKKEKRKSNLKKFKYFLFRYTNVKNYILFLKKKIN